MYTTFHLQSAEEITTDVLNAIKIAFKSKPIKITIEEDDDETTFLMSNNINKATLLKSIEQDKNGETITITLPTSA